MSKGRWLIFLAIGGLVSAGAPNQEGAQGGSTIVLNGDVLECDEHGCWPLGAETEREDSEQPNGITSNPKSDADYSPSIVVTIDNAPNPEAHRDERSQSDKDERERQEARDIRDLKAQETMAGWTKVMGITSAVGIPLLIATLLANLWAIMEARNISRLERRADLNITNLHLDDLFPLQDKMFIYSNGKVRIQGGYTIDNFGDSPAHDVVCKTRAIFADSGGIDDMEARKKAWSKWHEAKYGFIARRSDRISRFVCLPEIFWDYDIPKEIKRGSGWLIELEILVEYGLAPKASPKNRKQTFIRRFCYTNSPDKFYEYKDGEYAT